jgi:hypothetical protein
MAPYTLSDAIRNKQVTLGIFFACIVIGTSVLGYVWSQTDDQIDRGSKIGISVAFGCILAANIFGLIFTAISKLFDFRTASVGYRYPATLRYLLYALAISLATFCIVIISSNKIEDKTTQTSLAVTTGVLAVVSGFLGLYFHSTLLPIDFESLDTYSKNQGLVQYFPRSFLQSDNLGYAVTNSGLPSEVQDILLSAAADDNYTLFLKTLKDLRSSDIGTLRTLLVNGKPEVPYEVPKTIGQRAKDFFGKTEQQKDAPKVSLLRRLSGTAQDLAEGISKAATATKEALGTAKRRLSGTAQDLGEGLSKVATATKEALGSAKRRVSGTLDTLLTDPFAAEKQNLKTYIQEYYKQTGNMDTEGITKYLENRGFSVRPYWSTFKNSIPSVAKEALQSEIQQSVLSKVQSGILPDTAISQAKGEFSQAFQSVQDSSFANALRKNALENFDVTKADKNLVTYDLVQSLPNATKDALKAEIESTLKLLLSDNVPFPKALERLRDTYKNEYSGIVDKAFNDKLYAIGNEYFQPFPATRS